MCPFGIHHQNSPQCLQVKVYIEISIAFFLAKFSGDLEEVKHHTEESSYGAVLAVFRGFVRVLLGLDWTNRLTESPVAQWLEHPTRSRRVVGSNPIWDSESTYVLIFHNIMLFNFCVIRLDYQIYVHQLCISALPSNNEAFRVPLFLTGF